MCGIAGAFAIDGPLSPRVREAIEPMTSSIRHRGPDGAGYFADDHVPSVIAAWPSSICLAAPSR